MKKVHHLCKQHKVALSTVIFPDKQRCLETKMQNWSQWSKEGIVDAVTPLILTCDKQTSVVLIKDIISNTTLQTRIYPGLFVPFMGGQPNDLLRQIHENRKLKNWGIVLFDYAHLDDKYINTLTASAFKATDKHVTMDLIINGKEQPQAQSKKFVIFTKKEKKSPTIYFD